MSGRTNLHKQDETPGPGTYSGSSDVMRPHTPAFSMSGRHDLRQNYSDSPGPGAYSSSPPKSGKAVTMSGRHYNETPEDTPGPGTYGYKVELSNAPAFTFSGRYL